MQTRRIVFNLLKRMKNSGAYSNIALNGALAKSDLSDQDKSFATALFYGVLERQITLDIIIDKLTKGKKLDDDVRIALRMGLYQIIYLNSVPDSAAVNESVKLIKDKSPKGFVNAVLREYLRSGANLLKNPPEWVEYSCPEWLYEKWVSEYGHDKATDIIKSSIGAPCVVCRVNTVKTTEDELIKKLACENIRASKSGYENALILEYATIPECKAYADGLFHVEDISAQYACEILSPIAGEKILDLCAAPGGKTFTISEMMENSGTVLAFDLHEKRTRLIASGAKKLGLTIIKADVGNASEYNEELSGADRVLCDVPCSGLGIIRRKPEIKYKNKADFERLPQIQLNILNNGAKYVKSGGTLVYSTCTLSKAENEGVTEKFAKNNPDFVLTHCETIFPEQLRDGFFIAKFERK